MNLISIIISIRNIEVIFVPPKRSSQHEPPEYGITGSLKSHCKHKEISPPLNRSEKSQNQRMKLLSLSQ